MPTIKAAFTKPVISEEKRKQPEPSQLIASLIPRWRPLYKGTGHKFCVPVIITPA